MEKNENFYDSKEETLNVITHGIGFLLSIAALVILVVAASKHGTAKHITSFAIFGSSLIVLYAASTLYHYAKNPDIRLKLNILDHSAIYVLIAGTYTPFSLVVLKGWVGWTIFGVSWGLALAGIIFKVFYFGKYDKLSTIAYVLMGWVIIFAIKPLIESFPTPGLLWLFGGGLAYSIGAFFYAYKGIRFNHAIFHVFVLLGSFCHFMAVFLYVLPQQ
ncbi:PAQR family membrane homeostasis protein TrhA [Lutimonas sp.]|uniref:PAQR family membrane homeostasis protein TrhA n=1 Tax=Lutimonas sp. TaxID=1872403 RepID=UPI003D9AC903